jgi:tetratricopeptide (TPR) repeat protein
MDPAGVLLVIGLAGQTPAPPPSTPAVAEAYFLFLKARQLEQKGDAAAAVTTLQRALGLVPGSADIQAELAGVFAREGRAAEAVSSAEAALAIDAKNRDAHRVLGFVKSAVADSPGYAAEAPSLIKQAIRHLEEATAGAGSDLGAALLLGRLYAQNSQFTQSVTTIKGFLAEQPGYPEALLILAQAAEGATLWEDAADAWRQLTEMGARGRSYRSRYALALVKLGDQYFNLKRYKDAADAFDRALTSDRTAFDAADVTRKRDRARELAGK